MALWGVRVNKAFPDCQDIPDRRDPKGRSEKPDLLEPQVPLAVQVTRENPVFPVSWEKLDQWDWLEIGDYKVSLDVQVTTVFQDHKGHLARLV